jgi:MFS family permease
MNRSILFDYGWTGRIDAQKENHLTSSRPMFIYAFTLLAVTASTAAPSPIYPIYQRLWGFSTLLLTIIFAAYVIGLLLALVTVGSISDHIGRKPVVFVGIAISLGALACFLFARSGDVLVLARALQGLAIGVSTGALGAGMIDHQPAHRPWASFLNGVISPTALTIGVLGSGALVQFAPAPETTVYLVLAGLIMIGGILVGTTPERSPQTPGVRASLRPIVKVPTRVRTLFVGVIGCMISSWALAGFYLAFTGDVLSSRFGITSPFSTGAVIAVFTGCGALTGLIIASRDARRSMLLGAAGLIVGPLLTVAGLWTTDLSLLIFATAVAGVGFGGSFQGGLRLLLSTVPTGERAGLLASVYVAAYLAYGLPSIAAGALVASVGFEGVFTGYACFVILCAAVAVLLQALLRQPPSAELTAAAHEHPSARIRATDDALPH